MDLGVAPRGIRKKTHNVPAFIFFFFFFFFFLTGTRPERFCADFARFRYGKGEVPIYEHLVEAREPVRYLVSKARNG